MPRSAEKPIHTAAALQHVSSASTEECVATLAADKRVVPIAALQELKSGRMLIRNQAIVTSPTEGIHW